ncbi:MAG: TIGR00282 family metallophosphoesterase [bacterium]
MKILFIGDIIGRPGREKVAELLPKLKEKEEIDFVIANGENSAGGKGINPRIADEFAGMGIDVITLGNHSFDRKEVLNIIDDPRILRPINYPASVPGKGYGIFEVKEIQLAVISLMGRVYLPNIDDPFRKADTAIETIRKVTPLILVDFHAEITSEKQAMGWYLNGRVSAVIGTHTHVPTADAKILDQGTAYISDCGMVGPSEGIIGADREMALKRFLTGIPVHLPVAQGRVAFNGAVIEIDEQDGKAKKITQIIE